MTLTSPSLDISQLPAPLSLIPLPCPESLACCQGSVMLCSHWLGQASATLYSHAVAQATWVQLVQLLPNSAAYWGLGTREGVQVEGGWGVTGHPCSAELVPRSVSSLLPASLPPPQVPDIWLGQAKAIPAEPIWPKPACKNTARHQPGHVLGTQADR